MATAVLAATLTSADAAASQAGAVDLIAAINGGASDTTATIYDDTAARPAGPGTAVPGSSVALATLTYSATAFGTPVAGVATANAITGESSTVAGVALWGRLFDGDGVAQLDFDVVDTPTSDGLELTTTTIPSGGPLNVTAHTITYVVA